MDKTEKMKAIATAFVEEKFDKRTWDEVYAHMCEWAQKGWLSKEFIDECFDAIMEGRLHSIQYEPGRFYNYLAYPR